jgi:hypothetical protein
MPVMYGVVAPPSTTSNPDASSASPILLGKQADTIFAELHGKYYTQAYRNNLFIGSSAVAGVVPPIYSTTSHVFGLWNPAGNTKNGVLVSLDVGLVSGTIIISNWTLSQSLNAGANVATGAPISVFASVAPQPGNIGAIAGNSLRFTSGTAGTAATTIATTFLMTLGMSFNTTETTLNYEVSLHYDFDGKVIVPPNTAIWLTNNAASGATANATLMWEEVPV